MTIKKILKNEYVFSVITRFITIAIGMVQSILIARYLGAELKGVNAYVSSIASIGAIIITFGMHHAYPYFRKKYGNEAFFQDYVSLMTVLYAFYLLIGVICSFVLPLEISLKAVFIIVPLLGYAKIVDYITLIEHPNVRNTWWTVISIVDVVYVVFLWLFISKNIYVALSILVFADLMRLIVYSSQLHVKIVLHKGMLRLLGDLVSYGFFPMLALLMTTLNYKIDVIMLHKYDFISDAMIGVYSIGLALADKIVLIPDTLKGILVSKLAKGASDEEVAKVSRIGLWSSIFLFILIAVLGKWAITLLYGVEYQEAYSVVIITAFGLLAVIYFKFIAQYNIVNKKQKFNVALLSIAIITDIILNLLLIPIWGIQGAAAATSIGNVVCGVVFIIYFCKRTGVSFYKMIVPQRTDLQMIKSLFKKNADS